MEERTLGGPPRYNNAQSLEARQTLLRIPQLQPINKSWHVKSDAAFLASLHALVVVVRPARALRSCRVSMRRARVSA